MIEAITFDLDGVYFPNGKTNFLKALQDRGVSEGEAKRVFLKSDEMNNQYKLGKMSDKDYWMWAASEWGIKRERERE
jgi:FMN phosphatase YigB (HAD superfamily)